MEYIKLSYHHLNFEDRTALMLESRKEGFSPRKFAELIKRHPSTIYRELKRNSINDVYQARYASDNTAVAELNGAKPQYELIVNSSSASGNSDFTVPNMFFSGIQSHICIYAVNAPDNTGNSSQALACELQNVASILKGEFIYLNRDAQGTWHCTTSVGIASKLKLIDCV